MSLASLRAILCATTFLTACNFAASQETGNGQQEVADETETTSLENITIFVDRQGRKPLDLPANVTVIDSEEIDDRGITDMKELVRGEPGVEVVRQTTGADPFSTYGGFQVRGVGGNRVQMLVDGARVPERIIDGTRDYLDFNFTKQADIVRGPGSVLWGSDALGGIVALETYDPEDFLTDGKDTGGEVDISYSSLDDEMNTTATIAQRLSPELSFLGGLNYSQANEAEFSRARADGGIYGCPRNTTFGATPCNQLDPTDKQSYRGLAKWVYTPDDDNRFELSLDYLTRETDVDYNQVLGPTYDFMGMPTGDVITGYDRKLDLYRGRFAIEHDMHVGGAFVDDLKWSFSYSPNGYERTGTERRTDASGDSIVEEDFLSLDENFFELDAQLTSRFSANNINHVITWGFDGDITTTDYQRIDTERNLTAGTVTQTRGGGFNFANATTTRADFYIQDQIEFFDGVLEITPGIRYATYLLEPRPDADYQPVAGSEPREVSSQEILFALSANLELTENYSVYAAFNQGFKMPTAQQLFTSLPGTFFNLIPAPDLRPESVDNYEVGLRGEFDQGYFSVNGFYADYVDFIQSFYQIPGTTDYTYRNLSSVELYGIEASAGYSFSDNFRADLSFAWQQGTQQATANAAPVDFTAPPIKAVLGLTYEIPEYDLTLDAVTSMVAPVRRVSSINGFKPGGYTLLDLYAKWQPTENSELRLGLKNVFDQRYFEFGAADRTTTPSASVARTNPIELQTGAGRVFEIGYKLTF